MITWMQLVPKQRQPVPESKLPVRKRTEQQQRQPVPKQPVPKRTE
jgi:hypothetical protein